jgi:hypothetical protein
VLNETCRLKAKKELNMKTFLKLIICIISALASFHHVHAIEIASITAIRKATKVTIFENGSYKNLDYIGNNDRYLDNWEELFDANIGSEAFLAKHEIVPWVDVSNICKMLAKKEILRKIEFLNPTKSIENLVGEMAKEIYGIKGQLIECGIQNVMFNVIEEGYLISSPSVARKQMVIFSYMIDYSGRFMKINSNLKSSFQSPEFEIKSPHLDFRYAKEIENHSKKLFKQLSP